eukprot:scaffold39347_cov27-Phaeocystis_antarctica.AAC.1
MAPATLRHKSAIWAFWALTTGALDSAAARSKRAAASLSSDAERGPAPQAIPSAALSTRARMVFVGTSFGAALTTRADSALSSSSFHHSGLATSAHSISCKWSKVPAVASAQSSEPTG